MKNLFSYCFFCFAVQFLLLNFSSAQTNLVPNSSFEEYYYSRDFQWATKPSLDSIVWYWNDYLMPNGKNRLNIGTCYYTSDANGVNFAASIPLNAAGYQEPKNGRAYIGIVVNTYKNSSFPAPRNIVGTTLNKPLKIGRKYRCSFYLSPTEKSNVALNKFGMLFFTQKTDLGIADNESYLQQKWPNRAHIISDSVLSDTTRWYKIEQEFVADSAYTFLLIGNFFNLDSLTYQQISYDSTLPSYYSSRADYYLDAVEVIEITPSIKSNKLKICVNDSVYLRALNIDQQSNWYINDKAIQIKDSLLFKLNQTTIFYLKNDSLTFDSLTIEVVDNKQELIPHEIQLCNELVYLLTPFVVADDYLWSTGEKSIPFSIWHEGNYWLKTKIGDCTIIDSFTVSSCGSNIFLPNAFSPNADGINDWFEPVFTRVISFEIQIYDAWGRHVITLNQNNKKWSGDSSTSGVYFYVGNYVDENNQSHEFKGNVSLIK